MKIVIGRGARTYITLGESIFHNTWGHMAPKKNTSYKGKVFIMKPIHGEYGWRQLVLSYDFNEINGPYIHDDIVSIVADSIRLDPEEGVIYEVNITFRNYVYYIGTIKKVFELYK